MKNKIIYGVVCLTLIFAACSKNKTDVVTLPITVKTKNITLISTLLLHLHFLISGIQR